MKLAVISDIHANLPALEAVLADIETRQAQALYCLGDLVGYAPWPNEVVQTIWANRIPTIAGNYDHGVGLASDDCGCAYQTEKDQALGAESITYTNDVVTDEVRNYLRTLPRHLELTLGQDDPASKLLMVHGSPRRINEYLFEDRPASSLLRMMERVGADVLLFGHTHKPYHKVLECEAEGEKRYRHAVNTGSVGKPKDGDLRACYVLLDIPDGLVGSSPTSLTVEFVRVAYPVEEAATAVEKSPLPDELAQMLREAR